MNRIEWSEDLSVGVDEIDDQHRRLIDILNDLIDADKEKKSVDIISAIISRMADYIDYHFGTEEKYMTRFRYPGLESHRKEHRIFIRRVFDFRKQFSRDSQLLLGDMLTFLMDWLLHHIRQTDKGYSQCFRENGLA